MVKEGDFSPERGSKQRAPGHSDYDPLASMRAELDGLHLDRSYDPIREERKRRVRSPHSKRYYARAGEVDPGPRRLDFFIKGLEQFQVRFTADGFKKASAELRLLLAVGDANHPASASILDTQKKKNEYIRGTINIGQKLALTPQGLDHLISQAVEEGTLTHDEEGGAELTEEGLEAIEAAEAVKNSFRGKGYNFS